MTESEGTIKAIAEAGDEKVILVLVLEPIDDTLDALSQVYEWRIGERVKVIGNEPTE